MAGLPFVQKATRIFPKLHLAGVEARHAKPDFTATAWFSGKYAPAWERYFGRKVGFRGVCVMTVNQFNYVLFDQLQTGKTPVTMGKNNWLYETVYVREICKPISLSRKKRRRFVDKLTRLQDALNQRDKAFAIILSPTKPRTYPQFLPDTVLDVLKESDPQDLDYPALVSELVDAGVCVIDGQALFQEWRGDDPFLFPPGGTHWSYHGSLLFADHVLTRLSQGPHGPGLSIERVVRTEMREPVGSDTDLQDLANLLSFGGKDVRMPYPVVDTTPLSVEQRPTLLFVGDSFSLTLLDSFNLMRVFGKKTLLFYNSRVFDYPAVDFAGQVMPHHDHETTRPGLRSEARRRYLRDSDVIILCINRVHLIHQGWRFVDQAIEILEE